MVKDSVTAFIREEIISGRLAPGQHIVEGKWAARLGVAQASIREAIHVLSFEGFVEKGARRSAKVTELSEDDITQIYEVRGALEGLAARLVAEKGRDLADLEQLISDMRSAVQCRNARLFYERDLQFHVLICEKSGNRYLEEDLTRLIVPLFAFVIIRIHGSTNDPVRWNKSIEQHQQILDSLRTGDPFFAEQQVRRTIDKFFAATDDVLKREKVVSGEHQPTAQPTEVRGNGKC